MKQGGRDLTNAELHAVMEKIQAGKDGGGLFQGLQGIDAENTAPYFDDALESLVQQYGLWTNNYNVEMEYNRSDLREDAIHRALWAILIVQGYAQFGDPGYGDWYCPGDDEHHEISRKRSEAWDILNGTDV